MSKNTVTIAKWGAGIGFAAGADALLGGGALQAIAELCLPNSNTAAAAGVPQMPMSHAEHAMPWLAAGFASASVAFFASWRLTDIASKTPWAPRRRPALAALALIAVADEELQPEDIVAAWSEVIDMGLSTADARIAISRFAGLSGDRFADMFTSVEDKAALVVGAITLLRRRREEGQQGLQVLNRITAEMGLDGADICALWDAAHAPSFQDQARAVTSDGIAGLRSAVAHLARQAEGPAGDAAERAKMLGRRALGGLAHALAGPAVSRRSNFRAKRLSPPLSLTTDGEF